MDKKPYDPRSISNLILKIRRDIGCVETTQIELQKNLYFTHGKFLFFTKIPLISGFFEAWQHGPVHPAVYRSFRHYKALPITSYAKSRNIVTGEFSEIPMPTDHTTLRWIYEVVSSLAQYNASQLRAMSHAESAPWDQVVKRAKLSVNVGLRIDNETITDHFRHHRLPETLDQVFLEEIRENTPFAID